MGLPLPERIKVGGFDFEISLWSREESDAEEAFGQCDVSNLRISLYPDSPRLLVADTLLHEIGHAVFWVSHLDGLNKLTEESVVAIMASFWVQIFRDNRSLALWLIDVYKEADEKAKEAV